MMLPRIYFRFLDLSDADHVCSLDTHVSLHAKIIHIMTYENYPSSIFIYQESLIPKWKCSLCSSYQIPCRNSYKYVWPSIHFSGMCCTRFGFSLEKKKNISSWCSPWRNFCKSHNTDVNFLLYVNLGCATNVSRKKARIIRRPCARCWRSLKIVVPRRSSDKKTIYEASVKAGWYVRSPLSKKSPISEKLVLLYGGWCNRYATRACLVLKSLYIPRRESVCISLSPHSNRHYPLVWPFRPFFLDVPFLEEAQSTNQSQGPRTLVPKKISRLHCQDPYINRVSICFLKIFWIYFPFYPSHVRVRVSNFSKQQLPASANKGTCHWATWSAIIRHVSKSLSFKCFNRAFWY